MTQKHPDDDVAAMKKRADARFKVREAMLADAPVAAEDYRAARQAELDRIPRLRALRLARDAATKVAKPPLETQQTKKRG